MPIHDPWLPEAALLLGSDAVEILDHAARQAGRRVSAATPRQVRYRPGRSITVRYAATVRGEADPVSMAARAATGALPAGDVLTLEADGLRVAVWAFPADPSLPGLASAMDPETVRSTLTGLGASPGPVRLTPLAYRPTRRAVIRATMGPHTVYLKVVPPAEVPRLQHVHSVLSPLAPIPRTFGWSSDLGIVVLAAVPGRTLRERLLDREAPLPNVAPIAGLLSRLWRSAPGGCRRPGPDAAAAAHARLIGAVVPSERTRACRIADAVAQAGSSALATAHGDLHEAQLLVTDSGQWGLVDVDTVGPGTPVDDAASLLGHLGTLALTAPRAAQRISEVQTRLTGLLAADTDPADLARRVAGVVLGLATGPFRVWMDGFPMATSARLELADSWLAQAEGTLRAR